MTPENPEIADEFIGRRELTAVVRMICEETSRSIGQRLAAETAPLLARLAELEARPTLQYRGVWRTDSEYRAGDAVTHSGSLWVCNAPTTTRPGDGGGWTLAVKRGSLPK